MKLIIFICALFFTGNALAQSGSESGTPIEITAVETVEWQRDKNQYIARKDVIVTQGTLQIFTDLLTADYREGADGSTEIYRLTAQGNVQIKDETNTAYGDTGVYDVTGGIATLTGTDLKLVSPDQTVTATEKMEYYTNERKARAIGNATVKRATDTLKADTITAYFKDENDTASPDSPLGGGDTLDRLEAEGRVVITTPAETLYGQRAVYRADTNTAELIGKVRVERGENVLEGERADVNLTTNISKMYAGQKEGGRVRGVFFPGSGKKEGEDSKSPSPPSNPPASGGRIKSDPPSGERIESDPASGGRIKSDPPSGGRIEITPSPAAIAPAKIVPRMDY
jgi:lipopolysaccharide export system protein LptA